MVVLVAVDLLFATFVALQVAYLFGGRDTLATTGITYSEYARRGFFELLAVAFLSGGLIAGLEIVISRRSWAYVLSAVALAGLTLVVLASATLRLKLYQDAYGWTELRFYVFAAIAWLALGAVATAGLLLAARTRWLAHALGVLAVVVWLGINVVGPQGFVAQQNLARAVDPSLVAPGGQTGLDVWYLVSLGDDAVPVMVEAVPYVDMHDLWLVERQLRDRDEALRQSDVTAWPAWNLARERAREAIASYLGP
jgi:signal transduction histidine kinase